MGFLPGGGGVAIWYNFRGGGDNQAGHGICSLIMRFTIDGEALPYGIVPPPPLMGKFCYGIGFLPREGLPYVFLQGERLPYGNTSGGGAEIFRGKEFPCDTGIGVVINVGGCLNRGRRRWSVTYTFPRGLPNLEFGITGHFRRAE